MMLFCVFCVVATAVICSACFLKIEALKEQLAVEHRYADSLLEDLESDHEKLFNLIAENAELKSENESLERQLGDSLTTNLERAEDVEDVRPNNWDDAYEVLSELDK